MSFRPGARLASRPLHFIFLLDGSGSMAVDGKVDALNKAIREALPTSKSWPCRILSSRSLFVRSSSPTAPGGTLLIPLELIRLTGPTSFPAASPTWGRRWGRSAKCCECHRWMLGFPPVLVLVSDGQPTDDFESGLGQLMSEPWGRAAVRLAIAIGSDADIDVLNSFIADPVISPLSAKDPEQLAYLMRFVSVAASNMASAPAGSEQSRMPQAEVPAPTDSGLLVW